MLRAARSDLVARKLSRPVRAGVGAFQPEEPHGRHGDTVTQSWNSVLNRDVCSITALSRSALRSRLVRLILRP